MNTAERRTAIHLWWPDADSPPTAPEFSLSPFSVYMCVWTSLSADWASTGYGYQSRLWSAEQGKRNFPCPRSRLRVWSRELGSAVPSRVSPLVLHTQAESGAYLRDYTSPSRFPLLFPLEPPCAIGLVPSLSGHSIALPMAFTTENRHRASSSQGSSINGSFLLR